MTSQPKTSENFNSTDSDLTVESSDGVRFLIHRKNLETHTQVFPGAEFDTNGEITQLTEPANILGIVFQFIYPIKQPRLQESSFETVLAVAEAVQKYQIVSAVYLCEMRLKELVAEDPARTLAHVLRHYEDYDESLVNKAALATSRMRISPVLAQLMGMGIDQRLMLAWIRYQEKWDDLFAELRSILGAIRPVSQCLRDSNGPGCCNNCRSAMMAWIQVLQQAPSLPALEASLTNPVFSSVHERPQYMRCSSCSVDNHCIHRDELISACRDKIANMPQFSASFSASKN